MDKGIKVVQLGVGVGGKAMIKTMLKKARVEIVGAVDMLYAGKDLGEVVGLSEKLGIIVSDDLDSVLSQTKPDVMLDATSSFTKVVYPSAMKALEAGVNVISIGEELFNPWVNEPELARNLDDMAKKHGVSITGTGMSPGFVLDVLPLTFTGVCGEVKKIKVDRCLDSAEWAKSPHIRKIDGYGLPKDVAEKQLATGEITLHIAAPEQINVIADCLGWQLTEIQVKKGLLASSITRDYSPDYKIEPGQVFGYTYDGYGIIDGKVVIELKSTFGINPTLETDGFEPRYSLWIEGTPSLTVTIPELSLPKNSIFVTTSNAVNWIPHIIKAKPGLLTSARDFPLVTCIP